MYSPHLTVCTLATTNSWYLHLNTTLVMEMVNTMSGFRRISLPFNPAYLPFDPYQQSAANFCVLKQPPWHGYRTCPSSGSPRACLTEGLTDYWSSWGRLKHNWVRTCIIQLLGCLSPRSHPQFRVCKPNKFMIYSGHIELIKCSFSQAWQRLPQENMAQRHKHKCK